MERMRITGQPATWTGLGFARVLEGSVVEFQISDVPFTMEYDILLRYEPQVTTHWLVIQVDPHLILSCN